MLCAQALDGNARFSYYMGLAGNDGIHTSEGRKSYITPDTIKLPAIHKPAWMGEMENGLLSACPPFVGKQATRLITGAGDFGYMYQGLVQGILL